MLVLTREERQTVKVGGDVEIVVVSIKGRRVRLGIRAPSNVVILRGELQNCENLPHHEVLDQSP